MSDILALGALQAAAELGVRPPQLSVVGFDDSPAAMHPNPAVDYGGQIYEKKGRVAAEWPVEAIAGGMVSTRPAGVQHTPYAVGPVWQSTTWRLRVEPALGCPDHAGSLTHFRHAFRCSGAFPVKPTRVLMLLRDSSVLALIVFAVAGGVAPQPLPLARAGRGADRRGDRHALGPPSRLAPAHLTHL